jgi:ethanolamine utilization microcompartment shell protein EutS
LDTARIPNLSANKITTGQITAAANVKLNGHWLSGDGDNEGVYVANNGKVGIGTTNPSTPLQVAGGDIQMNSNSAKLRVGDGTYTYIADYGNGDSDKLQLHGSRGVIFTGGNVGIGTTTPTAKLDVAGNIAIPGGFIHYGNRGQIGNAKNFNPNNDHNGLWIEGKSAGIFMNENTLNLWSPGNTDILKVYDEDNFDNPLFVINGGGNVGIGTTTPTAKLEVAGNIAIPGGFIHYGNRGKIGGAKNFNPNNDNNGLWIEGSTSKRDGESAGIFLNENTISLWSPGNGDILRIYDEDSFGNPLFVINGSGKVGIGTTNPSAKLEVVGETKVSSLSTTSNIHMNGTSKIVFDSQAEYYSRIFWGRHSPGKNLDFGDDGLWITAGASGDEGGLFFDEDRFIVFNSGDAEKTFAVYNENKRKYHMVVDDGGKVGIGTENPQAMLDVQGAIRIGDWEIVDDGSLIFQKNGNLHVKFDDKGRRIWEAEKKWISDLRFKTNIEPLVGVTDKLAHIRAVYFNWNDHEKVKEFDQKTNVGLIADELEKVFPELVSYDKEGYRYIHYDKLSVVLLAAIKELHQLINAPIRR